ncbi:MAG: methylmalonyl-CoA mutase family protein [Myxococcota bacterium]
MKVASAIGVEAVRSGPVRVVTAAALFDGHDAAINIIRRLLQAAGAEVIHLGHDRSVDEIVKAAIQEDADAVAVSSYQGGHMEFFGYLVEQLRVAGGEHIRVYGGGGGTIAADEIEALQGAGVAQIFSPEDGQRLGLTGMAESILRGCPGRPDAEPGVELERLSPTQPTAVARLVTLVEASDPDAQTMQRLRDALVARRRAPRAPVVGFTGTGGAGKSTLIDELLRRFRTEFPDGSVAILTVDPTRRRSGGALLGDRIRLNAIDSPRVFVRSLATRRAHLAVSRAVGDALGVFQGAGFDLILVETAGIGQADSEIVDLADLSVYVMSPDYGAPSQLEKIDMLELAELVVLNKFDRRGGADALRDIRKQWRRNHGAFELADEKVPVFPTVASRWEGSGVDALYQALTSQLAELGFERFPRRVVPAPTPPEVTAVVPASRSRYLAEIAEVVRAYHARVDGEALRAGDAYALARALRTLGDDPAPAPEPWPESALRDGAASPEKLALRRRFNEMLDGLDGDTRARLAAWPGVRERYLEDSQSYRVRDVEIEVSNRTDTLSGLSVPKVALPRHEDWEGLVRYLGTENLPGVFPFTAGVFPFKRQEEDPTRMFAGEGGPERTNRRFHLLAHGHPAARLSTAFDSVTLYGRDPDERPDIYGKVGTAGASICTVDDAKKLYSGFDLLDPTTSVSMTINGPAPVLLAFFLNAAIDQAVERHLLESGRLEEVVRSLADRDLPAYGGPLPPGHSGLGLALLGVSGEEVVDRETYARIRADVLTRVRGTVQADILKEDQAQNTCIFSTEFALRLMGDIQEYFSRHDVRNFYSVSVSGYHMAEAGASPITQLAFTLANGLTYLEYYLARGLEIDDFAPNFSFFFSNGLDPEYSVIGRVARRIWAIVLRERYGAQERSQKLKYHSQTSGRSLHAQEMAFNDVRTTIQALTALQDRCDSLHTNAYDEAVTTPTEESVRRAVAIQLILNREFGGLRNENPLQGSYLISELTDRVEAAVLEEFERLSERGGVLGAMEAMYQRSRIQEESLRYEQLKHSGELPIVGVNTFQNPHPSAENAPRELVRGTEEEKSTQIDALRRFQRRHADRAPAALERLAQGARTGENLFGELMETVKVASLGQIVEALFQVGGRYRRAM